MIAYLSREWIDALARAAPAHELDGIDPDVTTVVEHRVDDATYHLRIDRGGLVVRHGPADDPTVVLTCDRDTAAAITRGELSAQQAFMTGGLRVEGDVMALARVQGALAALPDAFAELRDRTRY